MTSSLSKLHGAAGLRIGWAITEHHKLRDQLLLGKYNTVISCSPLDEALALRILSDDTIRTSQISHLTEARVITETWIMQHKPHVEWIHPDGGGLCCMRLNPSTFDATAIERFYNHLSKQQCRVARGSWFGESDNVFQLGFGFLSLPDLRASLDAISDAVTAARGS